MLRGYKDDVGQHRHRSATKAQQDLPESLSAIAADERNLRVAWDELASRGGQAPGPNGMTYSDFSVAEVWPLLRDISKRLREGSYSPGPIKSVRIPKRSGSGVRTLSIPNIEDRVVQRALLRTAEASIEPTLSADAYGGRPGRRPCAALARALPLIEHGRAIVISQDIRDAFDNVPINRLLDVFGQRIQSPRFVTTVKQAVFGSRKKGLHQGSPLSTLLMNLYIDRFVARPWRQSHPEVPLILFVDDILILCGDSDKPEELHGELKRLVETCGLSLKRAERESICDLRKQPVDWLGYRIEVDDGGRVRIHPDAWLGGLREDFLAAHVDANSPEQANSAIAGLLDYAGPSFRFADHKAIYAAVKAMATEMGFEEIMDYETFFTEWKKAYGRWRRYANDCGYTVEPNKRSKKQSSKSGVAPF